MEQRLISTEVGLKLRPMRLLIEQRVQALEQAAPRRLSYRGQLDHGWLQRHQAMDRIAYVRGVERDPQLATVEATLGQQRVLRKTCKDPRDQLHDGRQA